MNNFEETKNRKTIYQGKIIEVYEDDVLLHQNQQEVKRELVKHSGGVCVAAKTKDNKYLMVNQFRYAQQQPSLEFIAGKKEKDEDPFECIKRELLEEGGVTAKNWQYLGETFPSPAYLSEVIHLYTASDLEFVGQQLDENEFIELIELSLDEIISKVESNEIKDLKTIALAYKLYFDSTNIKNKSHYSDSIHLSPIQESDATEVYKHFTQDVIKYMYPAVNESLEVTQNVIRNMINRRKNNTDYIYTIRDNQSNQFIGVVGLHQLQTQSPELGIWMKKEAQHQGIGTQALSLLIELAKSMNYKTLVYPVDHRNIASTSLVKKLGGHQVKDIQMETTQDQRTLEIVVYQIDLD